MCSIANRRVSRIIPITFRQSRGQNGLKRLDAYANDIQGGAEDQLVSIALICHNCMFSLSLP